MTRKRKPASEAGAALVRLRWAKASKADRLKVGKDLAAARQRAKKKVDSNGHVRA